MGKNEGKVSKSPPPEPVLEFPWEKGAKGVNSLG